MTKKEKKDKKRKQGKGKKSLTTEDILKIIKKLKPKTQQIVRVNVGDKEKKGKSSSEYQPPFIFNPSGYQAITSIGQPPFQQPQLSLAPVPQFTTQPLKKQLPLTPSFNYPTKQMGKENIAISDISESEISIPKKTYKKKTSI